MKLHNKLFEISFALAKNMDHNFKHITAITDGNKIVCIGINKPFKTHPIAFQYGTRYAAIHSELDCILAFPYPMRELTKFSMYNIRVKNNGSIGMARPCRKCIPMLHAFQCTNNLFYTVNNGTFEKY